MANPKRTRRSADKSSSPPPATAPPPSAVRGKEYSLQTVLTVALLFIVAVFLAVFTLPEHFERLLHWEIPWAILGWAIGIGICSATFVILRKGLPDLASRVILAQNPAYKAMRRAVAEAKSALAAEEAAHALSRKALGTANTEVARLLPLAEAGAIHGDRLQALQHAALRICGLDPAAVADASGFSALLRALEALGLSRSLALAQVSAWREALRQGWLTAGEQRKPQAEQTPSELIRILLDLTRRRIDAGLAQERKDAERHAGIVQECATVINIDPARLTPERAASELRKLAQTAPAGETAPPRSRAPQPALTRRAEQSASDRLTSCQAELARLRAAAVRFIDALLASLTSDEAARIREKRELPERLDALSRLMVTRTRVLQSDYGARGQEIERLISDHKTAIGAKQLALTEEEDRCRQAAARSRRAEETLALVTAAVSTLESSLGLSALPRASVQDRLHAAAAACDRQISELRRLHTEAVAAPAESEQGTAAASDSNPLLLPALERLATALGLSASGEESTEDRVCAVLTEATARLQSTTEELRRVESTQEVLTAVTRAIAAINDRQRLGLDTLRPVAEQIAALAETLVVRAGQAAAEAGSAAEERTRLRLLRHIAALIGLTDATITDIEELDAPLKDVLDKAASADALQAEVDLRHTNSGFVLSGESGQGLLRCYHHLWPEAGGEGTESWDILVAQLEGGVRRTLDHAAVLSQVLRMAFREHAPALEQRLIDAVARKRARKSEDMSKERELAEIQTENIRLMALVEATVYQGGAEIDPENLFSDSVFVRAASLFWLLLRALSETDIDLTSADDGMSEWVCRVWKIRDSIQAFINVWAEVLRQFSAAIDDEDLDIPARREQLAAAASVLVENGLVDLMSAGGIARRLHPSWLALVATAVEDPAPPAPPEDERQQ